MVNYCSFISSHLEGWHLAVLVGTALATRLLPRFFCPEARGFDAYFHLIAARGIRTHRFRIPRKWKEFLLPGIYDYPPLYLYLVALFPVRWHLAVETFSSAVIDAVHGVAVYVFALYWLGVRHPLSDPGVTAFWVAFLFLMSPALTSVGTGPRAYQGTPRTLGELQFTLSMAAAICYQGGGETVFFLLSAFFGACLFLTSKFGIQVYAFFIAVLSFWQMDSVWLLLGGASLCTAFLISLGHYLVVLKGHVGHSRYYQAVLAPRFHMVKNFNRWEDIRNLVTHLYRDPRRAVKTLLMDNSYTQLVIKHPPLIYLGYLLVVSPATAKDSDSLLLGWVCAGLVAFGLTSLKTFRFLGEADRYLEYTLVPQFLLLAGALSFYRVVPVLLGYEVLLYAVFAWIFVYQFSQDAKRLPDFREMGAFIRESDDIKRLLPIYLGEGNQLAYETEKGVAHFPASLIKGYFSYSRFLAFYANVYPFPAQDLLSLTAEYGFDAVYFSTSDIEKARANGIEYDFDGWERLFQNKRYSVLKPPA